jgi:hypothetical protein
MKNILSAILVLCAFVCSAQDAKAVKDTLTWSDGTQYVGELISGNEKAGQIKFKTEDGIVHVVESSSVSRLRLAHPKVEEKIAEKKTKKEDAPLFDEHPTEPPINWSDPNIPRRTLLKHRTGIGLTATGTTLFVGGIIMLAVGAGTNGQTTTTTTSYSTNTTVNVGAVGGVGILSMIVGLPMMITGIVKLNKAKRSVNSSRIHLN